MRQIMQSRAIRSLCYALVVALLTTLAPTPLQQPASAQLMPTYSVGVADFVNESGVEGELLARLATDAVVVEMSKTNRYDVSITRTMMKTKMEEMGLHPPLTKLELVRVGEALSADAMLQGAIKSVQLAGSGPTRRASVTLVCQMIDEASGEIINGAVQTGTSSARVGYTADDTSLIAEAINSAAFLAVKTMIDYVIPEATVLMNVGEAQIMINKGVRDGIKPGMRMIVLRDKEIIGYVDVTSSTPQDATCKVIKSMRGIQPQDKVRAIFEMPTVTPSMRSAPLPGGAPSKGKTTGGSASKIGKFLVGALIVAGIASIFVGGRGVADAPKMGVNAPMTITWNRKLYNYGNNLYELQIFRDTVSPGPTTAPFLVIKDPAVFSQGKINMSWVYDLGASSTPTGHNVDYNSINLGATALTPLNYAWAPEGYGAQHTYTLRAIVMTAAGTSSTGAVTYSYDTTNFGSSKRLTCIEPVTADGNHIVTPLPGEPILVSDLRSGDVNLRWKAVAGATEYMVWVEPVEPGVGPAWHSNTIYHYPGSGDEVWLSDVDRLSLATQLSGPQYADKDMKWRVDVRNSSDSAPLFWMPGRWDYIASNGISTTSVFRVDLTPPGP